MTKDFQTIADHEEVLKELCNDQVKSGTTDIIL